MMKNLLSFITVALAAMSVNAQTETYTAIARDAETMVMTLSDEFKAVLPLNEDGSYGDVATNKDERGSVVVMKTASVTVEAVGGSYPADVPDVAGDNTATHVDINADGTVNSWSDIKWQQKNQGDINWAWIQGTGNPAAAIEAEVVMTDDVPATYVDENGVEHTKYRPVYTVYNPDGSLGVPQMGLYYKFTATTAGSIKIGAWVNKGNRRTYVVDASTALPVAYKAEGYINHQNHKILPEGATDSVSVKKYLSAEEIDSIHETRHVDATTGIDKEPYIIGAGNQPFFGYVTFEMEAGKTYYMFCENTQIGFNGWEFTPASGIPTNAIYYWEGGVDGATEIGGVAVANGASEGSVNYTANGDYYTLKINSKKTNIESDHILITLDQALEASDVIEITGYRNKDTDANGTLYMLFENGYEIDEGDNYVWNNIHPDLGQQPNTNTYVVGAGAGSKTIKITRSKASTNVFIIKLAIKRGEKVNKFIINDTGMIIGQSMLFPVEFETPDKISAFQCDIYLPEGVSLQTLNGKYDIALDENRMGDHMVSSRLQPDGAIRMVVASLTSSVFSGNSGNLFYLNLLPSGNVFGDLPISIKNISISDANAKRYDLPDVSANISISSANFLVDDVKERAGLPILFPISMDNQVEVSAFQCDICLPTGVTLQTTNKGKYDIILDESRKADHVVTSSVQADGTIRMIVASLTSSAFSGNSGKLFALNLLSSSSASGDLQIGIKNIHVSDSRGIRFDLDDVSATLVIDPIIPGDVNNDGQLIVDDIVMTINYILGDVSDSFQFAAADMNGDNMILVDDVVGIINAILGISSSKQHFADNAVELENLTLSKHGAKNGQSEIAMSLSNAPNYSAMQFDLNLPLGVTVDDIRMIGSSSHSVVFRNISSGIVRAVVSSLSNDSFNAGKQLAITLSGSSAESITITNAFASTSRGKLVEIDAAGMFIGGTTGIQNVDKTSVSSDVYDISGRLVKKSADDVNGMHKGVYVSGAKKVILK